MDYAPSLDSSVRIMRVRLFLLGHSFESIDALKLSDLADLVGYWTEDSKADEYLEQKRRRKSGNKS
jgi:hypothetical protein